jgi:uncharacterized protein YaiI (UPF0178 family)
MAEAGDLVITADIPLADRVVTKGAFALDPRGKLYTEANVKDRLAVRDLLNELRDGGMITGGPAMFGKKDRQAFVNQLDSFLIRQLKNNNPQAEVMKSKPTQKIILSQSVGYSKK